jgi:hypothetical protein
MRTAHRLAIDASISTKAKLIFSTSIFRCWRFIDSKNLPLLSSRADLPAPADRFSGPEHELVALQHILLPRVDCADPKRSVGHDHDRPKKLYGVAVIDEVFVWKIVEIITARRERLLARVANEAEAAEMQHL